jgi:HK97 family phage prohead protease
MSAPIDNLVRAWVAPDATELRAKADGGDTMVGHFAVFNSWTEIHSAYEGQFLERIAPGAFDDSFTSRSNQIRVLYDHGADPMIGNKPLGTPDVLREDDKGAYYEVSLFDASYVNDLKPAIRSGQVGASFRFKVTGEEWASPTASTPHNPQRLDERTITGVTLYEFGPVTFPAYPDATAGLRSRTDEFIEHFLNDPAFVARFKDRAGPAVVEHIRASLPPTVTADTETIEAPTEPNPEPTPTERSTQETDETADGGEDDATQRRREYFFRTTSQFAAHLSRL